MLMGLEVVDNRGSSVRQRHPAGLTVLELLVVVSIVTLLAAVLLPALERARESARRVTCSNNLHRIGLALHAYQSSVGCFPPGYVLEPSWHPGGQNGWGWLSMLLPMCGHQQVYNAINFSCHLAEPANSTVRLHAIELFLCPNERASRRIPFYLAADSPCVRSGSASSASKHGARHASNDPFITVSGASYAGVFGNYEPDPQNRRPGNGPFRRNVTCSVRDVSDGLSNTLFVGERTSRRLATTWTGMHQCESEGPERVVGFAARGPSHPLADEAEFSSSHGAGAHFLFGDGSVRFIESNVDSELYRAMATIAGGEQVDRDGL